MTALGIDGTAKRIMIEGIVQKQSPRGVLSKRRS